MSPVEGFYRALDELDAVGLPFQLGPASMEHERVEVHTASADVERVTACFAEHPFTSPDGTRMPVEVVGQAGSWSVEPAQTWDGAPAPLPPDQLAGLEMRRAAGLATGLGWRVPAFEPGAILTADLVLHRLNLSCSPHGTVTEVHTG